MMMMMVMPTDRSMCRRAFPVDAAGERRSNGNAGDGVGDWKHPPRRRALNALIGKSALARQPGRRRRGRVRRGARERRLGRRSIGVTARFLLLGLGEGARGADFDARHVVGDDDLDDGETAEDEARGEARGDEGVVGADGWEFRERAVGEGDDGAGADEGEGSSRLKTRESTVKSNRRFSLERTDRPTECPIESHLTVHDSESTPLSEGNIFQKLATKTAQPDPDPDRATHAAADDDADDETRGRAADDGE